MTQIWSPSVPKQEHLDSALSQFILAWKYLVLQRLDFMCTCRNLWKCRVAVWANIAHIYCTIIRSQTYSKIVSYYNVSVIFFLLVSNRELKFVVLKPGNELTSSLLSLVPLYGFFKWVFNDTSLRDFNILFSKIIKIGKYSTRESVQLLRVFKMTLQTSSKWTRYSLANGAVQPRCSSFMAQH